MVEQVEQVVNIDLWRRYCHVKQDMSRAIQMRRDCPDVYRSLPELSKVLDQSPLEVDKRSNEVLLLHGTSGKNVDSIRFQGFDDRLAGRELYGHGVYFALDFCKTLQYCEETDSQGRRCLFIARCVLGHPYFATGPMKHHRRPPIAEQYGVPYDSIIAQRGIQNGFPQGQVHIEAVVRDSQAYPDLLVRFRL